MTPHFQSVSDHLGLLFRTPFSAGEWVCLRGIGEKGTEREGVFAENILIQPALDCPNNLASVVYQHVLRWSTHGIGAFIVPGVLSEPEATSAHVIRFDTICCDIDSGNPWGAVNHIRAAGLEPSMVVASGGQTEQGNDKLHVYISTSRRLVTVPEAVSIRHDLAAKIGGDPQFGLGTDGNPFGRAHQPIRLAGSIHGKNGKMTLVEIRECNEVAYNPDHIIETVTQMQPMVGQAFERKKGPASEKGQMDFRALNLTEEVHEGGDGDTTRWSQFSRVAGMFISSVRRGEVTEQEALERTIGWMDSHMVPPWPMPRAIKEFNAILRKDLHAHGPFPEPIKPIVSDDGQGLLAWAAHRWSGGVPPQRKFLVDKLILAGKHQLLVAEGGAGKTFLMLDLALKVAATDVCGPQVWCGHAVKQGGTAVIITTEDDQEELHIRLSEIDQGGTRFAVQDRLIILPLINSGGSFALVDKDPKTQESRASKKWLELMGHLRRIKDLRLVVVDTLNSVMHGEENSATVINEFVRVASQVCGELGSALIITHHVRKQGDEPIRNTEDMKSAVRGSSALPAAFRSVLGIWHASDYERRMTAMKLSPKRGMLWKMAVIKANNPEMLDSELTLLRQPSGLLTDTTKEDLFNSVNMGEREAWLMFAVRHAGECGHPYSIEGKNAKSGLYRRRNELPQVLRQTGAHEFDSLVSRLMMKEHLVACAARGTKDKKWLDIPTGTYATDSEGAELSSGAYLDIPDWDSFSYDEKTKRIHKTK
jgi:hypothetical protein